LTGRGDGDAAQLLTGLDSSLVVLRIFFFNAWVILSTVCFAVRAFVEKQKGMRKTMVQTVERDAQ
jgi:hypothetical protein